MSSPLSSLDKNKKSPSNPAKSFGKRSIPFRNPDVSENELLKNLDENQSSSKPKTPSPSPTRRKKKSPDPDGLTAKNLLAPINSPVSPILNPFQKSDRLSPTKSSAPNDLELLSTMMKRITQLEKQTAFYTKEVFDKDKRIKVLEEKLALLKKAKAPKENIIKKSKEMEDLEMKCYLLQKQVDEMEAFLSDYGMIWVGEAPNDLSRDRENSPVIKMPASTRRTNFYDRPGNFKVDYDLIVRNVKELNMIAGEGVSKIEKTKDGARLKQQESVPLTLYANGIWMFNGPFRPLNEYTTMRCLGDLMDGYFPTELQPLYPDGVPLKIIDKRNTIFKDPRSTKGFPGIGRVLQSRHGFSGSSESFERPSPTPDSTDKKYEFSSQLPGPLLTMDQFLGKLPLNVVRDGKVVPIRSSLEDHLTDSGNQATSTEIVETEVTDASGHGKENLPLAENHLNSNEITTIRVKCEDGTKTYVLQMKFSETIADLRNYIDQKRPNSIARYDIMSTFPMQKHSDFTKTLHESGLTPNATLHLKAKK